MDCPSCGTPVAEGARFCSSCGHEIRPRSDSRRVLTVLFADLVGFTSLSETLDPEQVKNLVDRSFERLVADIAAFGGQVDKIIGDAVVALFGAPVAHEDDAERAVRAALRMQDTLASLAAEQARGAPLRMRIGVNTGEVLVGALRAGGSTTAMGDVVNTASRLQTAASPGQVLVGPATHAATRDVIRFEHRGLLQARGRDEPVEAWAAVEAVLPPGYRPRRLRAPLLGRDSELGLLHHAVDATVGHGRAHLVVLLGDAGLGKNRLAAEISDRAEREHGAVALEGRCVPYGEANVWWPVAEALRQACVLAAEEDIETARATTHEAVITALAPPGSGNGDGRPADDGRAAEGAASDADRVTDGLLHLMGYEGPLRDIDPLRAREEAARAVARFLEGYAGHQPVVLRLTDLHWADDLVLALIDDLVERMARLPFLLIATARPVLSDRWCARPGRHNLVTMHLDPLPRHAASELLDALLEGSASPELRSMLLDRAGGNPFYLEELVALVADGSGAVPPRSLAGRSGSDLPDTLRGLVAARLDGLNRSERETLDDAAVWGRRGPVEALLRMAEGRGSGHDVTGAVSGLDAKELLLVDGAMWSFRSDLVREVAYNTLTKADRAGRHHGIASWLEKHAVDKADADDAMTDRLARHYGTAARLFGEVDATDGLQAGVTERALHWVGRAAERSTAAEHHLVTARLAGEALELAGPEPSSFRVGMLLRRAEALAELRELAAARADVDVALDEARALGERRAEARAVMLLGDVAYKGGDRVAATASLGRAVALFTELDDRQGQADALRRQGMAQLFNGEFEPATAAISDALDSFCELGDRQGEAWALQNLAWIAFLLGRADDAETRLHQSIDTFRAIGDSGGLGWALGFLAFVQFHQGRFAEAEELGERVLVESRATGDRWACGMMLVLASLLRLWTGRPADAVGRAEEALALFGELDDRWGKIQALTPLGRALINDGQLDRGFEVLEQARDVESQSTGVEQQMMGVGAFIGAAAQVGDPRRALAAHGTDDVSALDPGNIGQVDRLVAVGLALLQLGRVDDARAVLARSRNAAAGRGENPFAVSAMALAAAAAGETQEALALAAETVESARATYLDRATAEVAAGLAVAHTGDEATARRWFAEARQRVDGTGDVVSQAVVRLAESVGLAAVSAPDADDVAADALARFDQLDLNAGGWLMAFASATGRPLSAV